MKISNFSEKFGLKKETIRFYTDKGLLIPQKKKNYYDYDEYCSKDMELIIRLKNLGFKLSEIVGIISFLRLSGDKHSNSIKPLEETFLNRKASILDEIENLKSQLTDLDSIIDSFNHSEDGESNSEVMWFPISSLSLLKCPTCGKLLNLSKATIKNQVVHSADLSCACSYKNKIRDGCIQCSSNITPTQTHDDVSNDFSNVPSKLIELVYSGFSFIKHNFLDMVKDDSVVLDIGGEFLFYNLDIIDKLPHNITYLILFSSRDSFIAAKRVLGLKEVGFNVVPFFLSNDCCLDLSKVDIVLDCFASCFISLDSGFDIFSFLKEKQLSRKKFIGTCFSFLENTRTFSRLPVDSKMSFSKTYQQKSLKDFFGDNLIFKDIGVSTETGYLFNFHEPGDPLLLWNYLN